MFGAVLLQMKPHTDGFHAEQWDNTSLFPLENIQRTSHAVLEQ